MVIHRILNGQKIDIELTAQELLNAYIEKYLISLINLQNYDDDNIKTTLLNNVSGIAFDVRCNVEERREPFEQACVNAILHAIELMNVDNQKNEEKQN